MIDTTNIDTTAAENTGGFISKGLTPGNHKCIILGVVLEENKFGVFKNTDGTPRKEWNIKLNLLGPALANFEGFLKDWNDPTKGKYSGQQAFVRGTEYGLYTGTTMNGHPVDRDKDLATWMKMFCDELGITAWLTAQNGQHATWDSLYAKFTIDAPYANKEVYFCLAAREYVNKKGYKAHDLFLPRKSDLGRGFSLNESLVQKFIESVHLKVSKPKTVEGFGNAAPVQTAPIQTMAEAGAKVHQEIAAKINTPVKAEPAVVQTINPTANTATPFTEDLFGSGNQDFLNQKDDVVVNKPIITTNDLPFSLD